MNRPIVITGAAGYAGSHLVRYFSQQGYSVVAVSRSALPPALAALPGVTACLADEHYHFDYPHPVEAVIHTAAISRPNCATTTAYMQANGLVTAQLAEWAIRADARLFLYLSSLSVYGQTSQSSVDEQTDRCNPCVYGISKYLGECALKDVEASLPSLSLRLPGIIGPDAQGPWLSRILDQALKNQPISLTNADAPFNNLIHVTELAEFCRSVLGRPIDKKAYVLTLAAAQPITVREVVETIVSASQSHSTIQDLGPRGTPFTISLRQAEQMFAYHSRPVREILSDYAQSACAAHGE